MRVRYVNHSKEKIEVKKQMMTLLALGITIAVLAAGMAQAQVQNASLEMTANSDTAAVGEPLTFTITKTNLLPNDFTWYVRDFLPAGVEFVSATSSQGDCALKSRAELGIPYNPTNGYDSDVVHCDLGTILSGETATIDITVSQTAAGKITNYAADNGENLAHATVTVE